MRLPCGRPGCTRTFLARPGRRFCSSACRIAVARGIPAPSPTEAAEQDEHATIFWHRIVDILHLAQLGEVPTLQRGVVSLPRSAWEHAFYRRRAGTPAASRTWDRFTARCRAEGFVLAVEPPFEGGPARVIDGWLHMDRARMEDAAFAALGPPHPGGRAGEQRAAWRREVAGLAWVLRAVARRRGEDR